MNRSFHKKSILHYFSKFVNGMVMEAAFGDKNAKKDTERAQNEWDRNGFV